MHSLNTTCPICKEGHLNYIIGAQDFHVIGSRIERISKDEDVVVCVNCRQTFPELVAAWKAKIMEQRLHDLKKMALKKGEAQCV